MNSFLRGLVVCALMGAAVALGVSAVPYSLYVLGVIMSIGFICAVGELFK